MKRGNSKNKILILDNNKEVLENEDIFYKRLGVDGMIRIQEKDYKYIDGKKKFITHFNLEKSGHQKNKIYALPRIVRGGRFIPGKEEVLPLLSFDEIFICRCVECREKVAYDELKEKDFEYSFKNIKNIEELKKEILYRYKKSMPNLSVEEILSLGVSLTRLEILNK